MVAFSNDPTDDELRERHQKMTDETLCECGGAAKFMCSPEANFGQPRGSGTRSAGFAWKDSNTFMNRRIRWLKLGCAQCKERTNAHFVRHITEDVLPLRMDTLSTEKTD
jgi:hypothetical protein